MSERSTAEVDHFCYFNGSIKRIYQMTMREEPETFYPSNLTDWRDWLEINHDSKPAVWVIFNKQNSNKEVISWSDAVDMALCYGWIDSKKQTVDAFRYRQFYSKRKPKSTWSKINKEKVEQLIASGQMMPAGLKSIEVAKANGSWSILDEVEALIVPKDLEAAFLKEEGAMSYYQSLSKSVQKMMLAWIVLAKRPETRQKRIDEIARCAGEGKKPKHFT